ncbi:MAG: F0F1 ATP synthase subunit gamma [Dysgonamonadaceae bacterium]|jgi:F-type H+-transporting ATPase subunit gamma|nr:F0F1 ATP synthase subunit gamma [Dysgonamonadaceae bacterium]
MASLKEVKTRINSVKKTLKITSAMKMVASAKLHRAQVAVGNMLPYQRRLNRILANFLNAELSIESPYVDHREVKRVALVAFSSNSSLCGAFNANVIKSLLQAVAEYRKLGQDNVLIFPIGKKVGDAVKRTGLQAQGAFLSLSDKPTYQEADALAQRLMGMYAAGEVDRVELIYHHFKSVGVQSLVRETYLPIDLEQLVAENKNDKPESNRLNDYIIEPSLEYLITRLIPMALSQKLYTASVDSNASEHAARTLAMQIATDNANDLIQDLTMEYNRSRQQAITNELLDIVGGSMK